ncbi:MAG: flagellar brake protein [Phycisphaerae bacterium]
MRPRRFAAYHDSAEILDHAVSESALAVITLQEGGDWRSFKSRFLERDPRERFFVLDYLPANGETLPLLTPGQYAGVSFRHKSRKIMFATIIEATGRFALPDGSTMPAIRYRWPESFTELQRRVYYRTPVPSGIHLLASLWRGGAGAAGKPDSEPFSGRLVNLSCGGALVRLGQGTTPAWEENATLGVEVQLADGRSAVVVDARYRGTRPDESGAPCAAFQFIGLEMTLDGRVVLNRIARCVQRFHRLLAPPDLQDRGEVTGR